MENELKKINLTERQKRIIKFWSIRGWDELEHTLGMNIKLNKTSTKHYPCLNGIDLLYLEQFLDNFNKEREGEE